MTSALTPADLATAQKVYRAEGTFAAAARAIGREESTVRKAMRRHGASDRAELFATELELAHVNALRGARQARKAALAALTTATDPRDIALLAHVLHENLRAVSTARTAHERIRTAAAPRTADAPVAVVRRDPSTMTDAELSEELRTGLAALADAARAGDVGARVALAPLMEAAQAMCTGPAIYLPPSLATPREE
jgi:hypothetical protein